MTIAEACTRIVGLLQELREARAERDTARAERDTWRLIALEALAQSAELWRELEMVDRRRHTARRIAEQQRASSTDRPEAA